MDGPVAHRKIELQSQEDFAYLLDNVRRAAKERLDEAFPPVEGDDTEDELRTQIEKLVNEYISKTFTLAAPNLSINGLPVDPTPFLSRPPGSTLPALTETYEPFDERAHARVLSLAREEEDLLAEIAALKHKVPSAVASHLSESFRAKLAADDEAIKVGTETKVKEGVEGAKREVEKARVEDLGKRQGEMEGRFGEAVEVLGRLTREMPATVAKMERARVAGEYVVTQGR